MGNLFVGEQPLFWQPDETPRMYTLPTTPDRATARRRSRSSPAGKHDDGKALPMARVQNLEIVWVQDSSDISELL